MAGMSASQQERLVSLDGYRGLAVAGMILVMNAGNWSTVYWPLLHAAWNGWTPTDMIFPSFLFIVGVSMTFSFASRIAKGAGRAGLAWHVVRRSAVLCALGLFLNAVPTFDLATLRIPGVLQRIALCYLGGGLLYLAAERRRVAVIAGVAAALLFGYWAMLRFVPVPGFGAGRLDSLGNLDAYVDRAVFGVHHLWPYGLTPGHGVTYDPEGLLSTIPAVANLLFGILAGEWLRSERSGARRAARLAVAGAAVMLAGWLLNPVVPINKRIWTSSFALFSGGFSVLALALMYWLVDLRRWRWWTPPALVFGTNAIFAYSLAMVLSPLLSLARAPHRVYALLFPALLNSYNASLAWAVLFVLLILALTWPLYRKGWFLRI